MTSPAAALARSVGIEYSLACLIASGLPTSSGPLVIEGRQPAVIARYARHRLGKVSCGYTLPPNCCMLSPSSSLLPFVLE